MELSPEILEKLYAQFFENYVIGISKDGILQKFDASKQNEAKMAIQDLESKGMIYRDGGSFKISTYGIDYAENELGCGSDKKEQRLTILELLEQSYNDDVDKKIKDDVFVEKLGISDRIDILSQMKYLEDKGYVDLDLAMGGYFSARLTIDGYHFLND